MTTDLAVPAPERHYLKCLTCAEPVAFEGSLPLGGNFPAALPACSYCGGKMRYMGKVDGSRWTRTETRTACDERCTHAQGPDCDCQCSGVNHGTRRVVTVVVESGVARITTPNDPKIAERVAKALAVQADFDTQLAEVRARLQAACAEVSAAKRNGEWLRGERYRLYAEGTHLQAELYRIARLRTPKGRLEALAKVVAQIDALMPAPAAESVSEVSVELEPPMAPEAPAPEPAAPASPAKPGRLMDARYPGICPDCKTAILVGEPICYDREARRAVHAECPSQAPVAPSASNAPAAGAKVKHPPTPQQAEAIAAYREGLSMAIKALAGTGKTSLIEMMALAVPERAGVYTAFNKSIVTDASGRMPGNVECQPEGTMVRVPIDQRPESTHLLTSAEVPIEALRIGDKVVTYNDRHGPVIRKRGRAIAGITRRSYDGPLVSVEAGGSISRYTPEHPCIANLEDAFEGQWLVYVMARGGFYKVGIAAWRLGSGRNGLAKRVQQEGADALWILSAHAMKDEALLAEALAQYEWRLPGWCFRSVDGSPLGKLWGKIQPNGEDAARCLAHFGRSIDYPLWSEGESMKFGQQTLIVAAGNLMSGMRVMVADGAVAKGEFGRQACPRRVWIPARVAWEWYTGIVTSLEVAEDHTYIADGIVTHNCSTAHSLAYKGIMRMLGSNAGRRYLDRRPATSGGHGVRQPGRVVAQILGIPDFAVTLKSETIVLTGAMLAANMLEAIGRFCNSAEPEPTVRHFPPITGIDLPDADGKPTYDNNNKVHAWLLKYLLKAWEDLTAPVGKLTLSHDAYFKLWELGGPDRNQAPVICSGSGRPAQVVFFDEAQDASPVMVSVVLQQPEATQVVWVGDPHQEIYGWRGAINALGNVPAERQYALTWSFRFGPEIARIGNGPLEVLGTDLRLEGRGSASSRVGILTNPRAILCRTNAGAVKAVLEALDSGRRPHLIGGGKAIEFFCEEALRLMETGRSSHPDLAAFGSWADVQDYVERDGSGADLKLLVKLIDQYGAGRILAAMRNMPKEPDADVVVSTVHKTKGREWETVLIEGDGYGKFNIEEDDPADLGDEELRVLYVAATRARTVLDYSRCTPLVAIMRDLETDALALEEAEPVA